MSRAPTTTGRFARHFGVRCCRSSRIRAPHVAVSLYYTSRMAMANANVNDNRACGSRRQTFPRPRVTRSTPDRISCCEHGFDDFAEAQCATFYAETMGRPSLPPGIHFRLLLIGYFEGIDSERGRLVRVARLSGRRSGRRAARPLDDFTDASVDRSRNASRRLHLGAPVPEYGRLGQRQG